MTDQAIIWHNPRCSKSRDALKQLQAAGIEIETRRYLDNPPTPDELDAILKLLQLEPAHIVRTHETLYRELGLKDKQLSRQQWLELLSQHPKLIQRPIVIYRNRAVVARPPEKV
ncbi:MAG TPA: arsenate reductase (glutaredoxin), partial [Piscirickettsiaceae bacterium]|nr:arsenate reductase (glutaredoxin) [Piscirickettsiaceae bacterium]